MITTTKKRICKIVDFTLPADQGINLKEFAKKEYVPQPCQRIEKLSKVTIVPIVIDAFGTITKELLKGWKTWKLADG